VETAVEAELAVRRALIAGVLIKPAAAPAYVKQKDLFRHIRDAYPDAWVASCGALLEKADAALDTLNAEIPKAVVDKWKAALSDHFEPRGVSCEFTYRTQTKPQIKGLHLYKFDFAGATSSWGLGPLVAQQ